MAVCVVCGKNHFDETFVKCYRTQYPLYWRVLDDNTIVYFCGAQHSNEWTKDFLKGKDANNQDYTRRQSP